MSYIITTEIDINAASDVVWNVLVDFAAYGQWSNFSSVEGQARVGARLTMRMPGFSFRPTVAVAEPSKELRWTGTLWSQRLFHGEHSFVLSPNPDGSTHLTNREEFSGLLVALTRRFMRPSSDNGYTRFNAGLKKYIELGATDR